jgi:hypothetical protein
LYDSITEKESADN